MSDDRCALALDPLSLKVALIDARVADVVVKNRNTLTLDRVSKGSGSSD